MARTPSADADGDDDSGGLNAAVNVEVHASWFTPARLLMLFCIMSLLIYVDRGVVSSAAVSGAPGSATVAGSGLQGDFHIGYYEYGLLQAAFMAGLLAACPVFSALAKTWNPFRLIGVGLGCWTAATMGCGFAPGYTALFVCRALVGVGEASFCALAAPFIDDFAPAAHKALWLAVFYLCIPLGVAGGFIYGGMVGGSPALGWRWAFIIESIAMMPVVAFCLASAPIPMRGVTSAGTGSGHVAATVAAAATAGVVRGGDSVARDEEAGGGGGGGGGPVAGGEAESRRLLGSTEDSAVTTATATADADAAATADGGGVAKAPGLVAQFVEDFHVLLGHPVYMMTLLGYVAYTAVIGVFAVWGPKAGWAIYPDVLGSPGNADLVLGLITVIAGVGGTVLGGVAVDKVGASIGNAVAVCAASAAVAFVFLEASFAARSFSAFAALFLVGETFAFVVQAPVNAVILWSVPPGVRPLACSMTTVFIHGLGDVPTPPLFGAILQRAAQIRGAGAAGSGGDGTPLPDDWRRALCGFTVLMAVSAGVLAGVVPLSRGARDYREEVGGAVSDPLGGGGGVRHARGDGGNVATPLLIDEAAARTAEN
jgi:MFS family permease